MVDYKYILIILCIIQILLNIYFVITNKEDLTIGLTEIIISIIIIILTIQQIKG
ncbi:MULTISPECIES: hypothetical protein [Methanobrevibacter]|uniref:hypothetical protein n=1 Tax=Methanobrevibacter TaxID=2172 RepID=UPI0012EC50ED|nr:MULTISPECIES: hypothetical protein [Methanobrevibacter]MDD6255936.1 hypothetical protein [Methanobrevibacter boviskoreani]